MLWRLVLDELGPPDRYDEIVVPPSRPALAAAARATGRAANAPRVRVSGTGTGVRVRAPGRSVVLRCAWTDRGSDRGSVGRATSCAGGRRPPVATRCSPPGSRTSGPSPGGVLAVASARFFQVIRSDGRDRFADPHLDLVLDRLAADGRPVVTVGLALDQRHEADWQRVAADDRLLPSSLLSRRWAARGDDAIDSTEVAARMADLERIPLEVEGWDLGPAGRCDRVRVRWALARWPAAWDPPRRAAHAGAPAGRPVHRPRRRPDVVAGGGAAAGHPDRGRPARCHLPRQSGVLPSAPPGAGPAAR